MNLYEYIQELGSFFADCDEGLIPEEAMYDTLESIQVEADKKIDDVASYIKSKLADAAALKAEAKTLLERAKAAENTAERMKNYLKNTMPALGYPKKFESSRNKLSFRASQAVSVDDSAFMQWAKENADDLLTFKEPEPNKKAIKEAIENGREVNGAVIVQNNNLIIK